eukprot:7301077-Alexandrium_andersonii.AAC.1
MLPWHGVEQARWHRPPRRRPLSRTAWTRSRRSLLGRGCSPLPRCPAPSTSCFVRAPRCPERPPRGAPR